MLLLVCISVAPVAHGSVDWVKAEDDAAAAEQCLPSTVVKPEAPAVVDAQVVAYEKYYAASLDHRLSVFKWQATASKLIFAMVAVLVLGGLVFSAIQFYVALRGGTAELPQEMELSLQSVKVKSQFLGVVTLALSLAFFYLYVSNVYPISVVSAPSEKVGK
jgi:hypothetical protein